MERMADPYAIESPYKLFTLPRPVDSVNGRIHAGSATRVGSTQVKERPDLVVGVDGECITVHGIKSSKCLGWYPISPQSYFTAPPCSTVARDVSRGCVQRYTYGAIRNELADTKFAVHCFRDEVSNKSDAHHMSDHPATSAYEIGSAENPVIYTTPIPHKNSAPGTPNLGVVVVQRNGLITGLTGDLGSKLWDSSKPEIGPDSGTGLETGHATIEAVFSRSTSFTVRKFLRARQDIASLISLDAADGSPSASQGIVLFLVVRTSRADEPGSQARVLHLVHVQPPVSGFTHRPPVKSLIAWALPQASVQTDQSPQEANYAIDDIAGQLQQLSHDSLVTYDFSKITPRLISRIETPKESGNGVVAVSSHLSLVSFSKHCCLYNVRYRSLHATQEFRSNASSDSGVKKRKRKQSEDISGPLRLVGYYMELGLVLGISDQAVVALQINLPPWSKRSPEKGTTRLIDSLGKNFSNSATTLAHGAGTSTSSADAALSSFSAQWDKSKSELAALAAERNVAQFDALFFQTAHHENPANSEPISKGGHNGHHPDGNLTGLVRLTHHRAQFALSLMFDWTEAASAVNQPWIEQLGAIKLVFMPPKVFRWLYGHGHLSSGNIEHALHEKKPLFGSSRSITAQDIVLALASHDPSLIVLSQYFTQSSRIGLPGTVETFKCLIRSFDTDQVPDQNRLLTHGMSGATEEEAEQEIRVQEEAATRDLTVATSFLEGGLAVRATALRSCLEKLGTSFPAAETVKALRSQLSRHELVLMIELLRIELAEGGWTSHLLESHTQDERGGYSHDEPISVISSLLNRAIDALGAGGWISNTNESANESDASLIPELRNETSAVLEGVQEATFFAGFIKDFLLYHESAMKNPNQRYQQPVGNVLPMGKRATDGVQPTRVAAGGEIQERSKRDIAHKLSQKVGTYTFETIRV